MTDSHGYTKPLYDTATPKRRTSTPPRQKLLVELDRFITAAKTRKYPKSNVQTIVRKGSCAYWTNRRLIIAGLQRVVHEIGEEAYPPVIFAKSPIHANSPALRAFWP